MSRSAYLIIHKDHPISVGGINSGAEMATLNLARTLARTGRRVVVAGWLKDGEQKADGVCFWDFGAEFGVQRILERARELGTYHLISAGRALPLLTSKSESACLTRSLISHDRSSNDSGISIQALGASVDNIFCVSEAQCKVFRAAGVDQKKLSVIHNGVDHSIFKVGDWNKRDQQRLVFVGALVEDKGIHVLAQSFAKLKTKYKALTADIYGSAGLWGRNEFFDASQAEQQFPGMKFHGAVSQNVVAEALSKASICVIPSIWFDPFPLVSIDAQACGCPVVAFDVGGLAEGIIDGETGRVIKEISEPALTKVLDELLSSPEMLRRMSDAAVTKQRPHFTWDRLVEKVCKSCEQNRTKAVPLSHKVGLLSTWNQECGLATYARYLFSNFEEGSYVVFAEEDAVLTRQDERFVERCWQRDNGDYSKLRTAIESSGIQQLYINGHYRFFAQPAFSQLVNELKERGIKVIAHLHSTFTFDQQLSAMVRSVDQVIVHSPENRLEAIANGAAADRVAVIPHGVHSPLYSDGVAVDKSALRHKLGMPENEKIVVAFGFVQPHKGMEGLVDAVAQLNTSGTAARGYIAGRPVPEDPNSKAYHEALKQLACDLKISERISFIDRFLSDQEVGEYLAAADLVLMNYRSQHYEASGACSLAIGSGSVVATSIAPPFSPFGDGVWHLSAGYPILHSIDMLVNDQRLRQAILERAADFCRKNSWAVVARTVSGLLTKFAAGQKEILKQEVKQIVQEKKVTETATKKPASPRTPIRVLMQNRKGTFSQRGGDSVVVEKLTYGLQQRGVDVTWDFEAKEDPAHFDLVHLFNFALPELLQALAQRAHIAKVPFVVTTLYEDIPTFHNQSIVLAQQLIEYVKRGQDRAWMERHKIDINSVKPCPRFENSWVAKHAAALFPNGVSETATIRRDFPAAGVIREIALGYEVGAKGDAGQFERQYGIKDFVLCVGRLESRKNQLMLLKALEDSELTVVLAAGGFSYQPEYESAVRNFKRKGKTIVLDRISPEMLASVYCAAKVHVLPSWYELPGLVSLEAAYYGCNLVVTKAGTTYDYFGDKAHYCDPSSEISILNAVLAAFYNPQKGGLKEVAMKHTWDSVADETLNAYRAVLGQEEQKAANTPQTVVFDLDSSVTDFQELLEKGEIAAKDREYAKAHELLAGAEKLNADSARLLKARGAVFLAEGNLPAARQYFERGLNISPADPKLLSGMGMIELNEKRVDLAYNYFIRALAIAPNDLVAILQLLECSYVLNRFGDLQKVLKQFVAENPGNTEMKFCWAGCLFKLGDLSNAKRLTEELMQSNTSHLGCKDLYEAIRQAEADRIQPSTEEVFYGPQPRPAWYVMPADIKPQVAQLNEGNLGNALARLGGQTAASAQPAAPAQAAIVTQPTTSSTSQFDATDLKLGTLEEAKRIRDYDAVDAGLDELKNKGGLRPDQQERVTLLNAEMSVLSGQIAEAEVIYDRVLGANANSARAMCGKGAIEASRSNWKVARELFENANRINPKYDVAWAAIGLCKCFDKDYMGAWDCYTKAVEINPENSRALLGIIELGYTLNRLEHVEETLKAYLEMHPVDLEFIYSLAGCYFAQNKIDQAIDEINKITLFNPSHAGAADLRRMIADRIAPKASPAKAASY